MTPLVPIVLFGWIPFTIFLFSKKNPRDAVLFSILGGIMFIPVVRYDLPLVDYTKEVSIAVSVIVGEFLIVPKFNRPKLILCRYDIPMIVYTFISPVLTSLSNGLGLYDGFYNLIAFFFNFGFYYWIGRRYFTTLEDLKKLCYSIVKATLIYTPFCLIEVIIGPRLNLFLYGFFAHSFEQHLRLGGYRPIVFMQHGLVVSLWLVTGFILTFWLWGERRKETIGRIPMGVLSLCLLFATYLSQSRGVLVYVFFFIGLYLFDRSKKNCLIIKTAILISPVYIFLRITNLLKIDFILAVASHFFMSERIHSLWFRLFQEEIFLNSGTPRSLFGWGGYGRAFQVDPISGMIQTIIDSLWLINYSFYGLVGLVSLYLSLLLGPWLLMRGIRKSIPLEPVLLSLCVILFCIDSLLNGNLNPAYTLCAGAVLSFSLFHEQQYKINDNKGNVIIKYSENGLL